MAEFCEECYEKIFGGTKNQKCKLTRAYELCEGCGEYKRVVYRVVKIRKSIFKSLFGHKD